MYDSGLKYKWDNKNVRDYALQEGIKKGMQKGIKQGMQKGLEKGRQEALAIAREMKKNGLPFEQILKFTRLSVEEIEKL